MPVGSLLTPKTAKAAGETGIAPPFAAIAKKFKRLPKPNSFIPGVARFSARTTNKKRNAATCSKGAQVIPRLSKTATRERMINTSHTSGSSFNPKSLSRSTFPPLSSATATARITPARIKLIHLFFAVLSQRLSPHQHRTAY
ncbi:MAG: hypothetical protein DDT19_02023 [Syntrophomonadaceae bacterium]|nr:hypothetical protein [Bacillota bacterium]